jgi:hypothetical protein
LPSKDTTTITTHTFKPREMLVLKLLVMTLVPKVKKPPPLLRKPLRRSSQPLKMSRLPPLRSLSQRLLINQLKLKEPGLKPELMMPPKLPPSLTTMLSVRKSSPICIRPELKIN